MDMLVHKPFPLLGSGLALPSHGWSWLFGEGLVLPSSRGWPALCGCNYNYNHIMTLKSEGWGKRIYNCFINCNNFNCYQFFWVILIFIIVILFLILTRKKEKKKTKNLTIIIIKMKTRKIEKMKNIWWMYAQCPCTTFSRRQMSWKEKGYHKEQSGLSTTGGHSVRMSSMCM